MVAEGRAEVPLVAKLERPEAHRSARRDPRRRRRGDGGARRPRPRDAARARAARAEGDPAQARAPRRAGDRRHAGARVDAHRAAPDARRSQRRRRRRRWRRRRDHAVGRDGGRRSIPVRSVEVLDAIIRDAEIDADDAGDRAAPPSGADHVKALCDAAVTLRAAPARTRSSRSRARGRHGAAALRATARSAPICAVTDRDEVARGLALWRGVAALVMPTRWRRRRRWPRRVVDRLAQSGRWRRTTRSWWWSNTTPDLDRGAANFLRIRRA